MRLVLLVAAALVASACATTPSASLRVHGESFTAGQQISGSLTNESSVYELQHGALCLAHLELKEEDNWHRAPEPSRACILPLLITPPSSLVLFDYLLDASLPGGTYRLRFEVQRGRLRLLGLPMGGAGESVNLASEPFELQAFRAPEPGPGTPAAISALPER